MDQRSGGTVVEHSTNGPEIVCLNQATIHTQVGSDSSGKMIYKMDQRSSGTVVEW